jgi:hypothetical protein
MRKFQNQLFAAACELLETVIQVEGDVGTYRSLSEGAGVAIEHLRVCTIRLAGSHESIGIVSVHILMTQGVPFQEGL